jgi:hypothetical protein
MRRWAIAYETRNKAGRLPNPPLRGSNPSSPKLPTPDLQPGDWVVVKRAEIEATLNDKGKNPGLWFDREMKPFCGQVFRVRRPVAGLLDETSDALIELTSDCVTLDGAVCSGELSTGQWMCRRAIYPYRREAWLERVGAPPTPTLASSPSRAERGRGDEVSATPANSPPRFGVSDQ